VPAHSQAMLDASRAVVTLFIDRGTSAFTIKELAAHAGISERTFYRYFPRKEDVVRPFLTSGLERVSALAAARPAAEPIDVALLHAWRDSWVSMQPARARMLFHVLNESDIFRAIWFQVNAESAARWAEVIADRIGIERGSRQAALAGAIVVAAAHHSTELFLDSDMADDPADVFASSLALIGPTLFTPVKSPALKGKSA
jgi:AcrR family transcriptional regulator